MKIVYFDVSAVLVLSILILAVYLKRMTKGDINRYYLLLLFTSLATSICDIWAVMLDNYSLGSDLSRYVSHSLYLLLHNMTIPVFMLYVSALTDSWITGKLRRVRKVLSSLPLLFIFILVGLNLYNHNLFYIDGSGAYVRGPWFGALYVAAFIYVIYGLVKVFM